MSKTAKQLNKTSASINSAYAANDARVLPHVANCVLHWQEHGNWTPLASFMSGFGGDDAALRVVVGAMVGKAKYENGRFDTSNGVIFKCDAIAAYAAGANGCTFREVSEALLTQRKDARKAAAEKRDSEAAKLGQQTSADKAKTRQSASYAMQVAARKAVKEGMSIDKAVAEFRKAMQGALTDA